MSSSQPSAYATARPRTKFERHFSAFTPPSPTSDSSNGHGGDLTLARPPARIFCPSRGSTLRSPPERPANSTLNPLPPKSPIPSPRRVPATRPLPANPAVAAARRVSAKFLDGDTNPDRSGEEICLLDGRLDIRIPATGDEPPPLLCISRLPSTFMDPHPPLWRTSSPAAMEARLSSLLVSFRFPPPRLRPPRLFLSASGPATRPASPSIYGIDFSCYFSEMAGTRP
ncbi:hypothetical protein K438DRAFT_1012702 [Mycena galopus ATCC 62051]|nr:hypothetical protein K438DRAFT_1012702 [Mycena galopus ATCC 62051]